MHTGRRAGTRITRLIPTRHIEHVCSCCRLVERQDACTCSTPHTASVLACPMLDVTLHIRERITLHCSPPRPQLSTYSSLLLLLVKREILSAAPERETERWQQWSEAPGCLLLHGRGRRGRTRSSGSRIRSRGRGRGGPMRSTTGSSTPCTYSAVTGRASKPWWRPRRACRSAATRRSTSSRPRSSASGRACRRRRRFTLAAPRSSASSRRPTLTPTCWCQAWTGHAPRLNPARRTSTRRAAESGRSPVPCTRRTKPLSSRCLPTTCASLWSTGSLATSSPPTRLSRLRRNSRGCTCKASTPSSWTRSGWC